MKTTLFTILLTLLSFSLSFGQTNATVPSGSGTSGDPYVITTLGELSWVGQHWTASMYFEQTANIVASETQYWDDVDDNGDGDKYNDANDIISTGNNEGWPGIGTSSTKFSGSYNGYENTIDGLYIDRSSTKYLGFFGYASDATIKNLGLINIDFTTNERSGGLLGANEGAGLTIDNCYSTGAISVGGSYVAGGLVGYLGEGGHGGTVTNSYSEVDVMTSVQYVGGFIGYVKAGSVSKCYSTGDVTNVSANSGAFIGQIYGGTTVSECYCTGSLTVGVSAKNNFGAFVGNIINSSDKISNCHASGSISLGVGITKGAGTGGFVGQSYGVVEYCYFVGTNNIETPAGFVDEQKGTITACFLDTEASGCTDVNVTEKTTTPMKTESTFNTGSAPATDWDFSSTWEIVGGDGANYPRLQGQPDPALPVELISLMAVAVDGGIMLKWETATEVNNYGFDVEASNDGVNYTKIGFVDGHGNSNSPQSYSLVVSVYNSYRLKQIDIDGGSEYSEVVTVNSGLAKTEMYQNNPNPFNPSTQISFSLANTENVKISVFNILGEKVAELLNRKMEAGNHKVDFNASNLTSGVYVYRIDTPNYTKSMKMMLLK